MDTLMQAPGANRDQEYLAAAEEAVRNYCGWHIAPIITETLILDGSGAETLFIPTMKIVSIQEAINGRRALDPTTLEWSSDGYLRNGGQRWTERLRGVSITLTHGHAHADHVVEIIRSVAARAAMSPDGVVRESAGAISLTPSMTASGVSGGVILMAHEKEQLETYKIRGGQ